MMKENVREIISRSIALIPTGDNCQPFSYRWEKDTVYINHDENIALHKLNYHNFTSLLSLGCLLENVKLAAADHLMEIEVKLNDEFPLKNIKIDFKEGTSGLGTRLSEYFDKRCTDRRMYEGGLSQLLASYLEENFKQYQSSIKVIESLPKSVLKHFISSDGVFWKDSKVFFDTLYWIRFSRKKILLTKDGLSAKNLGLNKITKIVLWIASRNKVFQNLFRYTGAIAIGKMLVKKQIESAGGFVFFYPPKFGENEIIETGKLAQRVWLELTKEGYAIQPLTLGTMIPFLSKYTSIIDEYSPAIGKIFVDGAVVMDRELSLPIWGFRFGKVSSPLPQDSWTYRREIDRKI